MSFPVSVPVAQSRAGHEQPPCRWQERSPSARRGDNVPSLGLRPISSLCHPFQPLVTLKGKNRQKQKNNLPRYVLRQPVFGGWGDSAVLRSGPLVLRAKRHIPLVQGRWVGRPMGPERAGREEDSSSVSDSFKALVASNLWSSSSGLSISLAHSSHTCPTWPHRPYLLFLYLFKQLLLSMYSFSGVAQNIMHWEQCGKRGRHGPYHWVAYSLSSVCTSVVASISISWLEFPR